MVVPGRQVRTKFRSLRETRRYAEDLRALGDLRDVDEALYDLTAEISAEAESFPFLQGQHTMRAGTTAAYRSGTLVVPSLTVIFRVVSEDCVELEQVMPQTHANSVGTSSRGARTDLGILLDPDVAQLFPDSAAVNEALRLLVRLATAGRSRI
jgi:hypothetical protein